MAVPNRIREEARAADEQLRQLASQQDQPSNEPSGEPPTEPRSLDDHFAPGQHPNEVDHPPGDTPSGAVSAEDLAALQQRHDTLQGMHNRDKAALAETRARVETLEAVMRAQQAAAAAAPTTPAAPAAPVASSITEAEEREFGADLIDVCRRVAREELTPHYERLAGQIQQMNVRLSQLSSTAGAAAKVAVDLSMQQFEAKLDSLVVDEKGMPDWQRWDQSADNGDSRFVDWLHKTVEYGDETRLTVLQRAYQNKDAAKCAELFNGFKRELKLPTGKKSEAPSAPAPSAPVDPAAAFVSPSPVAPSNPTSNRPGKRTFTLAEVTTAYDDYTKGKYKGKEAEWKRLSAEIEAATMENRISK